MRTDNLILKFKGVATFVGSQEKNNLRKPELCLFSGGQLIYLPPKRYVFLCEISCLRPCWFTALSFPLMG